MPTIMEGTRPLTGPALPNLKPYRIGGHPAGSRGQPYPTF